MSWVGVLGFSAATLILFSMLFMKSQVKFHSLNAVGYLCLCVFGLVTRTLPVVYFSVAFVLIDFSRLYVLFHNKLQFDILQVDPNEQVFKFYCERNKLEIDAIFGAGAIADATHAAFVFRNNDIAGILAYAVLEDGVARIFVDYVSSKYRDGATGRHLFVNDLSFWHSQGIHKLELYAPSESHIHYLGRMGFTQSDDPATWEKEI